jgi:thymidylate synthase
MNCDQSLSPILGDNISLAWAKAFCLCYETPGGVLPTAFVKMNISEDKSSHETPEIRRIVDNQLRSLLKETPVQNVVETVAGTIFPASIWRLAKGDRHRFFDEYKKAVPFIRRKQANRRGLYFERLIAFPGHDGKPVNQLEHIINTWKGGNHRRSALQAAIFDPSTDHSNSRQLGFPCLQQVVFYPNGANGADGLTVVAFYANQTIVDPINETMS